MSRKMKDSGVEWIGNIPKEWSIVKIAKLAQFINGYAFDGEFLEIENEIPVIRIGDIQEGGVKLDGCLKYKKDEKLYSYSIKNKDVLIAMSGATTGKTAFINEMSCLSYVNQRVGIIRSPKYSKYINYSLNTGEFKKYIDLLADGSAQPNISTKGIMNYYLALPESSVDNIVNYLDKKVSQIDDIISKQKSLIQKYKAYKQSLITETVTKGLNKNVPMKDSGIEWIGEIPSHWDVKKMKYLGTLNASGVDKKIRDGEKLYKSVHYVNVYKNGQKEIFNREDYLVISCDDSKATNCTLLIGDVLFTNSSETAEDMGACTVIAENLENTLFGYHLMRFRPDLSILWYKYEKYLFSSNYMRKWFEYNSVGMTRYGLAQRGFSEAQIIYAPYEEQKEIADFLDRKCNAIDSAISKKEQLILKLEDYKKSLIYECVTGKREVN